MTRVLAKRAPPSAGLFFARREHNARSVHCHPPMTPVDLRLDAGVIVPVEPPATLRDHALIVDGGRIVALLPQVDADLCYAPRERMSLPRHVLMPGLINAHTHAAMSLFRGIADDLPLARWLEDHIWPREARIVAPAFVYDGARLAAAEMLKGGITCCNDMYFFPDAAARGFVEPGMRAMLGLPVLDFPTAYAADPDGYLQTGLAVRDALRHEPRLAFSLAPHAPYTVGDAAFEKIVMYARQLDLPIQTHLARDRARSGRKPRAPRRHAARAAAPAGGDRARLHRDPRRAPDRCRHRTARHARRSRRALPGVEHEARQRYRAGCRHSPRHGINVALGTDGAASNNRPRSLRRNAARRAARQGPGRRCRRVAGGRTRSARRRSAARARSDSSAPGLARPGQGGRRRRRRLCRARCRSPATIRSRISSTRSAATRSPTSGSAVSASSPIRIHDRRRGRDREPRALWQERLQ